MVKVSQSSSKEGHLIESQDYLKKRSQSLIHWRTIHHPSVHVVKVPQSSSSKEEHSTGLRYRLKNRSQSLIHRRTIHHPSVHVQRINRPASFQERIITPSNQSSHIRLLRESYTRSNEVKRFVECYNFLSNIITAQASLIDNSVLTFLPTLGRQKS